MEEVGEKIWCEDSGRPGESVCISFGVHGNERPPIEAGSHLVEELLTGRVALARGKLMMIHANPRASAEDERWSKGGVDLNRCFHASVLARDPELFEERRAREIVAALEEAEVQVLVDFHCTVEPGPRFLMHHPPAGDEAHRRVRSLLSAEILLADPDAHFGGVSLDEWMSMRGRVGICYETGWMQDPDVTPAFVRDEMTNVLTGLGLLEGRNAEVRDQQQRVELFGVLTCEAEGFVWEDGVGENLQALRAGERLGRYPGGKELALEEDATLIFPKKRPELVRSGKPLTYLARLA